MVLFAFVAINRVCLVDERAVCFEGRDEISIISYDYIFIFTYMQQSKVTT